VLGIFSPEEYTHFTPGWSAVLLGTYVATFLCICAAVYPFYPDKPTVPRTFPGGLDRELGGPGAVIVSSKSY
jgi:NADH dehydrogenase (ubiquinone) 1 beta subcomplex subunit 8